MCYVLCNEFSAQQFCVLVRIYFMPDNYIRLADGDGIVQIARGEICVFLL
jgi:hypothetical protein